MLFGLLFSKKLVMWMIINIQSIYHLNQGVFGNCPSVLHAFTTKVNLKSVLIDQNIIQEHIKCNKEAKF